MKSDKTAQRINALGIYQIRLLENEDADITKLERDGELAGLTNTNAPEVVHLID